MMRSRLSKAIEKKQKQKLILTLVGSVIILFLLVRYGIPALVNFSLFLGSSKNQQQTTNTQQANTQFIAPPILTQTFTATNSATIKVTGSSQKGVTIKLFINNAFSDSTTANSDGSFHFDNVTLSTGQNTITVKAQKDNNSSDFSDPLTITYASKAPNLTLDSPSDGQTFDHDHAVVTIKGKTDPDVHVTVNDFWAITDSNGNYSYTMTLQNGDNQIKVVATDTAGNKTEKDIKLTLQ